MLTRFTSRGFKRLADVSVDLAPLTVLVGPNGVGKSTLLDGVEMLLDKWGGVHFHLPDAWESRADASGSGIGFEVQIDQRYAVAVVSGLHGGVGSRLLGIRPYPSHLRPPRRLRLRLDVGRLGAPSLAATTEQVTLEEDGAGLPTLLQAALNRRDDTLEAIEAELRTLVPDARRVRTRPTEVRWTETEIIRVDDSTIERPVKRTGPGHSFEIEFDDLGWIAADEVSDGTLMALGFVTVLHVDPPELLLIDDAERDLHPLAQQQLVGLLRRMVEARPGLQVILTTHSPDLVDACRPDEVRVFGHAGGGRVAIRRLDEHPEAPKWLNLLRTGEFWSSVGEGWVGEDGAGAEQSGAEADDG